jgi:hypothetical protein
MLTCLAGPWVARGDGYVFTLVPTSDGTPGIRVGVNTPSGGVSYVITIDTGNGQPNNGGLTVNNNPLNNVAQKIGMTGGTPGKPIEAPGNAGSPANDNVNMPANQVFLPAPKTPPSNKTTQPTLPNKATTTDLRTDDALIGIKWLDDNFRDWGQTKGKNGKFFYMTKNDESAEDANTTHNLAVKMANAATPTVPNGRPIGTDFKPIVFIPSQTTPSGALFVNGGFAADLTLSNRLAGTSATDPFIISTGMSQTLISSAMASELGLNVSSLPLETVGTGFGSLTVPFVDLTLKLFDDPNFPTFDLPVGILSTASDPFNENFLGNDVLGSLPFWEMTPSADGLSGTFYATPVPEPSTLGASLTGFLFGLLVYTRRRRLESRAGYWGRMSQASARA